MKNIGFGKRLLTMLLVLAVFVSSVPVVRAADGDLASGNTGLKGDINTSKTISWPIKIYDYLNDGMLFEYSSASDFQLSMDNGSYGGGTSMPMNSNMPGMDFTISSTYESYAFKNWGNKSSYEYAIDTGEIGATDVIRSATAAVKDEAPMYLHLEYADYAANVKEKAYGWIANFARDNGQYYTGDQIRYMAIVYRTGGNYPELGRTIRPYWAVSDSTYTVDSIYHPSGIDISDLTDHFGMTFSEDKTGTLVGADTVGMPGSSEWTVFVVDMKTDYNTTNGIASNWTVDWDTDGANELDLSTLARVAGVGISFPLCNEGETMDISHIAFFSSEEEARNFGNNAIAFNNDPGEYVGKSVTVTQSRTGGTASSTYSAPTVSSGDWDFTTSSGSGWSNTTYKTTWSDGDHGITKTPKEGVGYTYTNITCPDTSRDSGTLWEASSTSNLSNRQYITLVYRIYGNASPQIGFWVEDNVGASSTSEIWYAGGKGNTATTSLDTTRVDIPVQENSEWVAFTYDLEWLYSKFNYQISGFVTTINRIGIKFPGFTSAAQSMDIAYVKFSSSSTTASNFETAATSYLNNFFSNGGTSVVTNVTTSGTEYKWNMGSNQAFTMLYASNGGGWFDDGVNFDNYNNYTGTGENVEPANAADKVSDNDTPGGNNTWTNGYFSYMIGDKYTWPSQQTNYYRQFAAANGYTVADDIFLLDLYPTNSESVAPSECDSEDEAKALFKWYCDRNLKGATYDIATNAYGYYYAANKHFDMSQLDLGYTLYNDLTEGVMTAGLLQSSLITQTGIDGKDYTIIHYKDDTVSYIARLLQQTLVIPERDGYGYNYNFVKGTPNGEQYGYADTEKTQPYDLASALRDQLGITFTESNYTATTRADAQETPTAELGSPEDTASRLYDDDGRNKLIGPYLSCKDNIETFYDAAYYLLHNLFVDDSYNERQNHFNYLVMSNATLSNGKEVYVFDGGFTTVNGEGGNSAINYDPILTTVAEDGTTTTTGAGTISLTSAAGKTQIEYSNGYYTTQFPFLPIYDADDAAGDVYTYNKTPYAREDGALNPDVEGDTYEKRNYNYVMQANGEFVYHYEDSLFFQFEGDDDVYLFVNGELVLDIGAAHAITAVSMDMNDYVLAAQEILNPLAAYGYYAGMPEADFATVLQAAKTANATNANITDAEYLRWHRLNLVDGESYSIDFYYMERHGWGANMRVATNIVMTDPALGCDKTAYQNGTEISYGGIVEKTAPIEYSFALTNNGNSKLYNLTFDDHDIGVTLDPENGLTVATGFQVSDASGSTLDAADLVAYVDGFYEDGSAYETIKVTFADNDALKAFLEDLTGPGLQSGEGSDSDQSGGGLWKGSTVTIRGIYYTMSREQQDANQFDNTVYVSATTAQEGGSTIKSEAGHRVRSVADAIHFYQWAGHPIGIHRNYVYSLLTSTVKDKFSNKSSYFVMYTCQSDGTDYSWADVTGNGIGTLFTASYAAPGRYLIYIKLYVDKYTGGDTGTVKSNRVPDVLEDTDTTNDNDYDLIPVIFYVTDVEDSTIVLDYGLKAELTGEGGIYANDVVQPHSGAMQKIMGITSTTPSYMEYSWNNTTGTYQWDDDNRIDFTPASGNVIDSITDGEMTTQFDGKYSVEDGKLYFTPTDFMDSTYTIYAAVSVYEEASGIPHNVGPSNYSLGTKTYDLDISKEVQMYQKVTVLPANVVYYEDDFDGITYKESKGAFITHTDSSGAPITASSTTPNGSDTLTQSVDQTIPYGQDPAYQASTNTAMSGNSLHTYEIQKDGDNSFASFTFTGTGFEIIGQTNAIDSGTMVVKVTDDSKNEGEEDKIVYHAPVITEFDNNADSDDDTDTEAIYQVPVVRVDGLTYGSYTVTLEGSPEYEVEDKSQWVSARSHYDLEGYSPITQAALDGLLNNDRCIQFGGVTNAELNNLWVNTYITQEEYDNINNQVTSTKNEDKCPERKQILLDWLGEFMPPVSDTQKKLYIDGVRIFQPYGDTVEGQVVPGTSAYYSATESGADFEEVRELIMDGKVAFVNYKGNLTASTADMTWVENRNGTYQYNYAASVEDYLIAGPNNEVYLRRTGTSEKYGSAYNYQALVLYVSEVAGATGSLQVGIRAMDHKLFLGKGTSSAIKMDLKYRAAQLVEVQTLDSSTEQYYTIDYTNCPTKTVNGKTVYEVVVFAQNTSSTGMVAFTSLKHNGLTIESIVQPDGDTQYETGTTWAYIDGVLTETVTGNTSSCVHMNLQELSEVMRMISLEEQNVPEEAPEVVPAPERVKPVTDIVADDGDKGFSTGTMVIIGVCVVTALVAAYLLTKKYLRYL